MSHTARVRLPARLEEFGLTAWLSDEQPMMERTRRIVLTEQCPTAPALWLVVYQRFDEPPLLETDWPYVDLRIWTALFWSDLERRED